MTQNFNNGNVLIKSLVCNHYKHQVAEREFYANQKNPYSGTRIICLKCGENIFLKDKKYGVYNQK